MGGRRARCGGVGGIMPTAAVAVPVAAVVE